MGGLIGHEPTTPSFGRALATSLRRRCPRCGEGALFSGFLTVAPACGHCDLDLSKVDSGDGPAVFVIFVLGFVVVGGALWVEVAYMPPYWVHAVLWLSLSVAGVWWMLPRFKALLIAMQFRHDAAEGQIHDD